MSKYLAHIFAYLVFKYQKKRIYESENTWHNFFLMTFSNIKKNILTNLKIPGTVFCLSPFQMLKKDTYKSQNTLRSFFPDPLFKD